MSTKGNNWKPIAGLDSLPKKKPTTHISHQDVTLVFLFKCTKLMKYEKTSLHS